MRSIFIKDLSKYGNNSINTTQNLLVPNDVREYDSSKTYVTGNLIVVYDITLKAFKIKQCKEDGVTGEYNVSKWIDYDPLFNDDGSIDCGTF